jgi:lactate dehydrogenase-like 2-hydroxyacid dehydrogenase
MAEGEAARPRVVLTRRWPAAVEAQIAERFDAVFNTEDRPMSRAELADALASADALCPTVTDGLDAELLGAPGVRARLLANFGVGFNHIDLEAAAAAGMAVSNTPGVLTDCTADLAMTLILMTARRAGEGERELRSGAWTGWRPTHLLGRKVTGKVLGVIGAGRIGLATARRARHGFGMQVLLNSRSAVDEAVMAELGAEQVALDVLLERSDFVSLHCPSTPETHHLIDASALDRMPGHSILLNTARGDVVDEAALADALAAGRIGGAGLDVYEREPEVTGALLDLPNVVLLPHLGSGSEETRVAMGLCALANLKAFFADEPLPNPVAVRDPE